MSQASKEDKLKQKLEALEDRHEAQHSQTTRGVVYRLFDTITSAKAKGYTWKELAEILSADGVKIKGSTLSYYYRAIKKEREAVKQEQTTGRKTKREEKKKTDQTKRQMTTEELSEKEKKPLD